MTVEDQQVQLVFSALCRNRNLS